MSFGFGVGDFIATLNLFERVAIELQNYRDAPARFQQLRVELELLRSTLLHVLHTEPNDLWDGESLDRIRAITVHCYQPLQAFLLRMRSKESCLGHFSTTRTFNNVSTRLHWSMVTQKEVDDIRKIILSEMTAINVLLSVQQLNCLKRISHQNQHGVRFLKESGDQQSDRLVQQTTAILEKIVRVLDGMADLRSLISRDGERQAVQSQILKQDLANVSEKLSEISRKSRQGSEIVRQGGANITQAMKRLFLLLQQIRKLVQALGRCSKEMLEAIARNTRMLLDISNQMKRVIRAIEAIPLHLTLDIVRLDAALGESWALPFQACTTWNSFKNILQVVVYGNGRPGAARILSDRFIIQSAKTGGILTYRGWENNIKAGAHIQQAMVISELSSKKEICPYPSCPGTISRQSEINSTKLCTVCGRSSTTQRVGEPLLQVHSIREMTNERAPTNQRRRAPQPRLIRPLSSMDRNDDELSLFRRIHLHERGEIVNSLEEANELLLADENNAHANQVIGWWYLVQNLDGETAIPYLERGALLHSPDPQSWYLLGRAYLLTHKYFAAYQALQECINQFRDSLEAFSRSIRLNGYIWENWYNLGVLYENCHHQAPDAIDAYQRCLDLNTQCHQARNHLEKLRELVIPGTTSDEDYQPERAMKDSLLLHVSETAPVIESSREFVLNPLVLGDLSDEHEGSDNHEHERSDNDEDSDDQDDSVDNGDSYYDEGSDDDEWLIDDEGSDGDDLKQQA